MRSATDVYPLLERESTLPHRAVYLATAGDIEGGSHSLLEIDFLALARRAGIQAPLRQAIRRDHDGRRRYLDAEFNGFTAEVDGAVHLKPLYWWDDMVGIRLQPERVIEQLQAAERRWPR